MYRIFQKKLAACLQDKKSGVVRFSAPEVADAALAEVNAKAEEERKVGGCKASLAKVEGEQELQYYKRVSGCLQYIQVYVWQSEMGQYPIVT